MSSVLSLGFSSHFLVNSKKAILVISLYFNNGNPHDEIWTPRYATTANYFIKQYHLPLHTIVCTHEIKSNTVLNFVTFLSVVLRLFVRNVSMMKTVMNEYTVKWKEFWRFNYHPKSPEYSAEVYYTKILLLILLN